MTKKSSVVCGICSADAAATDDFCPACGCLLVSTIPCAHHGDRIAEAACIICAEPFCAECGTWVRDRFLCNRHRSYEIIEGMVRIFGVSDSVQAQYAADCLTKARLHPVIFERKASPISLGGPDYTLFRASGDADGHIINETKVMVPCQEVPEGEKVLRRLGLVP